MRNWVEIAVGVYLLGMVLYGHYRGFIRQAVSMFALVATFAIVNLGMPKACTLIKDNTPIVSMIEEGIKNTLIPEDVQMPAQQRQIIEEMRLPDTLKDLLIENNNSRIYEALGVTRFQEYIGSYIANTILNVVAYVMMLIVVYLLIKVLVSWLDIVTRLPILSGMNKIAGAILGGVQGLLFFWIAALLLTAFATTAWGSFLLIQIETSTWLSILYHINPISRIALGILHGILT